MTLIDKIKRDREAGTPLTPEQAALLAADELAEAVQNLMDLRENTSPFGGEIMRDRVERTEHKFTEALAAWNAATKGDQHD